MDKKKMIETAISMLQEVDPETIEVVNFDRTEYKDGSVGFSVNLTTPPKEDVHIGPRGLFINGCTIEKYSDTLKPLPSTKQLSEELEVREGVESHVIGHDEEARINIDGTGEGVGFTVDGPATLIVNRD